MDIKAGTVIISTSGHDKGRLLLVTGAEGRFVYLADGKERRLAAPKKKNLKHVRPTAGFIDPGSLTDKRLRTTLRGLGRSIAEESE